MLIVEVKDKDALNTALKVFKKKVRDTQLIKELRKRKHYEKPSVKKRTESLKAKFRNQKLNELEGR